MVLKIIESHEIMKTEIIKKVATNVTTLNLLSKLITQLMLQVQLVFLSNQLTFFEIYELLFQQGSSDQQ